MKTFHKDTTTAAFKARRVLSKDAISKKKKENRNTRQHLFWSCIKDWAVASLYTWTYTLTPVKMFTTR